MIKHSILFYGRFNKIFNKLTAPKSKNKDSFRREFILNILLLGSLLLSFTAVVLSSIKIVNEFPAYRLLYLHTYIYIVGIFVTFLVGYILSRLGKAKIIAILLILVYFLAATYTAYTWGADNPGALLIYCLVIVISGIVINSRFAFIITFCISIAVIALIEQQTPGINPIDKSWITKQPTFGNGIVYAITFFVIAVVSWLSNREIEKSLKRARASERELKRERDQLEVKVEERTRELQKIQLEKISQLYRFAEIGRLTAGFMHDLVTPISLISLNLDQLSRENQKKNLEQINILLKRAINGTRYLENFVTTARKQLQNQNIEKTFSLNNELRSVIQVLAYKAKSEQVKIVFNAPETIKTFGNPFKFNQVIMNLILNAIDSYHETQKVNKTVIISLTSLEKNIVVTVQDFGVGIAKENVSKIFNPFYSTKLTNHGTGIGLSITEGIVKQTLHGKITVKTAEETGTTFTLTFPKSKLKK